MAYSLTDCATIIADSSSSDLIRLTTMQLRIPRMLLPEISKHRVFSINARSSRAVPFSTLVQEVMADPFIPTIWGAAVKGMCGTAKLDEKTEISCEYVWLEARDRAVDSARKLYSLGLCKGLVNRLLEPFAYTDLVISATDWRNFFHLRCHANAEPHMRQIAETIRDKMYYSNPKYLACNEWHLPFITPDLAKIYNLHELQTISAGRCAMVSYNAYDAENETEHKKDYDRGLRLLTANPMHAVPFEHIAEPAGIWTYKLSNFRGWNQLRGMLTGNVKKEDA